MNKILLILTFLLFNLNFAIGLDKINQELLRHAKEAKLEFKDVKQLHDFLIKPAKSDREKAELFFYWISQHIEYDFQKYDQILNGGKITKYNIVLEKKGVCEDFTKLFKELCDISNIECYRITGYGKTRSYKKGSGFKITHAWNIIKLDNEFEFVDCTWGSGNVTRHPDGNPKYNKEINISQVFVNSNLFRTSHLPESAKWQLLEHPVSYEAYDAHSEFSDMYTEGDNPFMFKDSIKHFNSIPEEYRPIQERIDAYRFNPSYRNGFECGRGYELVAQKISRGAFNLENIKRAKSYYETSKKWYVKSFKQLNNNSDKPDRSQIVFIKNVNKRIKYCEARIKAKK